MKTTRSVLPIRLPLALPLLAVLTLLSANSVFAADRIWQGASSIWSDTSATGWNAAVPTSSDNAWLTNAAACTVTNDAANQLSSRFVRLGRSVTLDTGNFFQNQLSYLDFTSGGTLRLSRTSHFQNYGTCIFPNNFTLFTTGTGSTATITNTLAGADNFINLGYTNSTLTFSLAGSSTMNVYAPLANGTDSGTGTSNYVSGINVGTGGTVVLGAVNTYTGPTAIGSGGALIIAGAGSLGSGSYAGNITNAGTFTYNSTAAQTLSGTISGGGTFVKTNTSTLTLAASNSYSGGTTIGGGTLKIDAGAGGTNSSSSALTFYDSGTFNYDNTTASAAKSQNMGALNAFGGEATVQLTRTASQTVSNYFSSWGGRAAGAALNLVKAGTPGVNGTDSSIVIGGTVAAGIFSKGVYFNGADFAYANSAGGYARAPVYGTDSGYSSVSTLTGNSLTHNLLTASCSFSDGGFFKSLKINSASSIDITNTGATWYWSGSSFGQLLRTGGGSTTIYGPGVIKPASAGDLVFRTDTASDTVTVNAVIADNGTTTLTKCGAGTMTLNGTNAYTGVTTVDAGTLLINNNQTNTGAITVMNGATLGGSGTISNTVTVNNGGTLQPSISGSVSTLTLGSATAPTLSAGSSLKIRVPTSSTADKVLLSSTTPAFTATGVNLVIDATGFSGSASGLTIVQVAKTSSGIVGTFNSITVTGVSGYNATPHYNTQTITLDVAPSVGAVDASHSTISPATATKTADGSSTQVITVQARDVNNNNRVTGGDTVVFSATAGTVGSTTDNGNGTYTATWTAPTSVGSGTATVTATLGGTAVGTAVSASSSVITLQAGAL
ncbi:MAG: autotransporter-associated beta strand repeat-containing protein, partial [Verrucomicrobia bacterium]|nr:autotransporter-associated beta strand repeat-containing protein [Verrucomicrobiota bacterium]